MPGNNLAALFSALEQELIVTLEQSRTFAHSGNRGDVVETAVRQVLHRHLPRYLSVGTGEAVDRNDTRSGQIDVVIANQDQPIRRGTDEANIFLVEGIAGAGEVKSRLSTQELRRAIDGGARFKRLRNEHLSGDQIFSNPSDRTRFVDCPPYFLLAFGSDVATTTLLQTLYAANDVRAADATGALLPPPDAVFILGSGRAINYGDGQGSLGFVHLNGPLAGQRVTGWAWHPTGQAFVVLLLWLNATMPRVARLGSIATPYLMDQLPIRQALSWPPPSTSREDPGRDENAGSN